ncbi:MAG: hypothetical protein LBH41_00040 [Rickettsiales bacterium]|nr:hypothetical protein [Rickettsiales bacterium]
MKQVKRNSHAASPKYTPPKLDPRKRTKEAMRREMRRAIQRGEFPDCHLCGEKIFHADDLSLEHLFPRRRFPELDGKKWNLVPAHAFCNSLKGDKTIAEWFKEFSFCGRDIQALALRRKAENARKALSRLMDLRFYYLANLASRDNMA